MADLIDRMTFHEDVTGRPKILNHQFTGWMTLYAYGIVTRGEIATAWDLQDEEVTQAELLADEIDNKITIENKISYCLRVDAVAMLLDSDDPRYVSGTTINKSLVYDDLGIS